MGIFGFGEDSPLPTASTVSAENPPDELNYSAAEFRLNNDVAYDTRTGYQEQFPEQEDLSIFGWTNYPDPAVGFGADAPAKLTYAQQCMADRDACYAKAGTNNQAILNCDGAYSTCFAHDPAFITSSPAAQKAAQTTAVTRTLLTLGLAGALGAGVFYGGARLFKAKPATAGKWAIAGGALLPAIVISSFVKALETM
jgi:hypothetical protein